MCSGLSVRKGQCPSIPKERFSCGRAHSASSGWRLVSSSAREYLCASADDHVLCLQLWRHRPAGRTPGTILAFDFRSGCGTAWRALCVATACLASPPAWAARSRCRSTSRQSRLSWIMSRRSVPLRSDLRPCSALPSAIHAWRIRPCCSPTPCLDSVAAFCA